LIATKEKKNTVDIETSELPLGILPTFTSFKLPAVRTELPPCLSRGLHSSGMLRGVDC